MRILIAEDDATSARLLERILRKQGYEVVSAGDGQEALTRCRRGAFDVLITDWMMPRMDGIELIRQLRDSRANPPFVMVLTSLDSAQAREHALQAGADDYLAKPYNSTELLNRLRDGLARYRQPVPKLRPVAVKPVVTPPPFMAVCLAASTGGPETLRSLLRQIPATTQAAFFIVVHGPGWMLETLAERLRGDSHMPLELAGDGVRIQPGRLYLAPGDRHLLIESRGLKLRLTDTPPENYVRPAADPLFRSAADAFGKQCIAVVLTGLGRDGTLGAVHVAAAGGVVISQDPATAIARSMPQTVIDAGCTNAVAPLDRLARTIEQYIDRHTPATAF